MHGRQFHFKRTSLHEPVRHSQYSEIAVRTAVLLILHCVIPHFVLPWSSSLDSRLLLDCLRRGFSAAQGPVRQSQVQLAGAVYAATSETDPRMRAQLLSTCSGAGRGSGQSILAQEMEAEFAARDRRPPVTEEEPSGDAAEPVDPPLPTPAQPPPPQPVQPPPSQPASRRYDEMSFSLVLRSTLLWR